MCSTLKLRRYIPAPSWFFSKPITLEKNQTRLLIWCLALAKFPEKIHLPLIGMETTLKLNNAKNDNSNLSTFPREVLVIYRWEDKLWADFNQVFFFPKADKWSQIFIPNMLELYSTKGWRIQYSKWEATFSLEDMAEKEGCFASSCHYQYKFHSW